MRRRCRRLGRSGVHAEYRRTPAPHRRRQDESAARGAGIGGRRMMLVQSMHFKARAGERLADQRLQQNLKKLSTKFVSGRASAITELDDFEGTRDAAKERRMRAIENLDVWLDTFEQQAVKRGATVLYAQTAEEASRLVVEIAKKHGVKKATKTK